MSTNHENNEPSNNSESLSPSSSGSRQAASSVFDTLESWHQNYTNTDIEDLSGSSPVIRAVESDQLDSDQIEAEVQRVLPTVHVTQGFCRECRHLLDHWPTQLPAVGRSLSTVELEAAARVGCKFCALVLSRLKYESKLDTIRKIEVRMRSMGDHRTASLSIGVCYRSEVDVWLNFPGKTAGYFPHGVAHFDTTEISPKANLWDQPVEPLTIARTWLERCLRSHEPCCTKTQYRPPTRLVSIGQGTTVKLAITSDMPTVPRYATLSYCWGPKPFTKLTKDNLESFLSYIPREDLPKTFNDAIDTARQLGIEFIWIDALCIIQQEPGNIDWAKEAGYMRSVYGGAFVNLAVASSTSVHQGFPKKQEYHCGGFTARVTTVEDRRSEVRVFASTLVHYEATKENHLAKRAWAFQERLLPARIIYFSDTGLFWECRSLACSEYIPDGIPFDRPFLCPEDKPWDWYSVILYYSAANLTYASDKLPALSGIAARQHKVTGDQYLAGLWRRSLIKDLLWSVDELGLRSRPEWRAPSWSWMSVDSKIWPYISAAPADLDRTPYVRVLDVWTRPSGPDPHGPVAGGQLQLACSHLIRGQLSPQEPSSMQWIEKKVIRVEYGVGKVANFVFDADTLEDASDERDSMVYYLLPILESQDKSCPPASVSSRYHLKRLRSLFRRPDLEFPIWALVLQASGHSRGYFRRAGRYFSGRDKAEIKKFLEISNAVGVSTAAAECVEELSFFKYGKRRYMITIE